MPSIVAAQTDPGTSPPRYEFSVVVRMRAETRYGVGDNPAREDGLWMTRTRLEATLRPSKTVRFFAQAQDSRVAGLAPGRGRGGFHDAADLRQGYVEIGREDGPVILYAGRREFDFIDERLLGERRWNNVSPAWDGAQLTLQGKKAGVHLFGGSQVEVEAGFNPASRTRYVYGAVGAIEALAEGHLLEPFFIASGRPAAWAHNLGGQLFTTGARLSGEFAQVWDYQLIAAGQGGGQRGRAQRAWMGVGAVGKTIERAAWRPRLSAEWNFASGDSDPDDGRIGTFDTLFPSPHRIHGLADMTAFRNIQVLKTGLDVRPRRAWTLGAYFLDLRLASRLDTLYQLNNRQRVSLDGAQAGSSSVGSELDFTVRYSPGRRVDLSFVIARFFAGEFVTGHIAGGSSQTFLNTILQFRL